jgi:hypothetical protein
VICYPCRDGALLMQIGKRDLADQAHANCYGGTWCDCAHQTSGSALNQQALTELKVSGRL